MNNTTGDENPLLKPTIPHNFPEKSPINLEDVEVLQDFTTLLSPSFEEQNPFLNIDPQEDSLLEYLPVGLDELQQSFAKSFTLSLETNKSNPLLLPLPSTSQIEENPLLVGNMDIDNGNRKSPGKEKDPDYQEPVPPLYIGQGSKEIEEENSDILWREVDEIYFHPDFIFDILHCLPTLKSGTWIEYACLENFMIIQRLKMQEEDTFTHYVPQMNHTEEPTPHTIVEYHQVYHFDPSSPQKPTCILINPQSTHWWGLYVDRNCNEAYILGRSTTRGLDDNATQDWLS
ncbi:hypothetical protein GYMLUDRAFT_62589 [Collybiopsis luxurians FD-317 M1]|uniref:Unplaced genomic scaffold GYMLUscaffold_59, whole genome shotgun sequence n=1 Tax=Collybiopsis luxurians FD-317 M1 TaxID=944289 RepID=A0A0D0BZE5_9AGAR|nr:hypothetical protein GYMLUDRAFT_62589 [Collybiopsis luxurians FD-317 M1]